MNKEDIQMLQEGAFIRTVAALLPVRDKVGKFASIVCQLQPGVCVKVLEVNLIDGLWIRIDCGWVNSVDTLSYAKAKSYEHVSERVAREAWDLECSKKKRMASAITAMLVKAHPLPKAKRFVRSLLKHANEHYPEKALILNNERSMEDIMISLGGQTDLNKQQVFEYIKVAAAKLSNPQQAIIDITQEIFDLIFIRPTLWVTDELNVLETENVRLANDRFVMAAAGGDIDTFMFYLNKGQELTNLHSELKYTALHAAADFGQIEIVKIISKTGISFNMRDPRYGMTPLHFAGQSGRAEVAQVLIDGGADRTIVCNRGMKAFEWAHKQGHIECREVIKLPPPDVKTLEPTAISANHISVEWELPAIHAYSQSPILEFSVHCIPADFSTAVDGTAPVPTETRHEPLVYVSVKDKLAVTYRDLIPSTMYKFTIRSRSLSGWSAMPLKAYEFHTLSTVPEPPQPMEILKVAVNGLLLFWNPPLRNNGYEVTLYNLEVIDAASRRDDDNYEDIDKIGLGSSSSGNNNNNNNSSGGAVATTGKSSRTGDVGALSKWHRLLRHKNVDYRVKYMTGLEPNRPYLCRVRACNQLGPGPWSMWTEPIAPHSGVSISEFSPETLTANVTWFAPLLNTSIGRRVEKYELQLCNLKGPLKKHIVSTAVGNQRGGIANGIAENELRTDDDSNEFVTITNALTENKYQLSNLKSGMRYQCRVRCKIADEQLWQPWDTCVFSDIFSVPATPPEAPFDVRPALVGGGTAAAAAAKRSGIGGGTKDGITLSAEEAAAATEEEQTMLAMLDEAYMNKLAEHNARRQCTAEGNNYADENEEDHDDYNDNGNGVRKECKTDNPYSNFRSNFSSNGADENESTSSHHSVDDSNGVFIGEGDDTSSYCREVDEINYRGLSEAEKAFANLNNTVPTNTNSGGAAVRGISGGPRGGGSGRKKSTTSMTESSIFSNDDSSVISRDPEGFMKPGPSLAARANKENGTVGALNTDSAYSVEHREEEMEKKEGFPTLAAMGGGGGGGLGKGKGKGRGAGRGGVRKGGNWEEDGSASLASDSQYNHSGRAEVSGTAAALSSAIDNIASDEYDISHDSITVMWSNGGCNGRPIEGYRVEMAQILNYNPQDVLSAKEAFLCYEESNLVGTNISFNPRGRYSSESRYKAQNGLLTGVLDVDRHSTLTGVGDDLRLLWFDVTPAPSSVVNNYAAVPTNTAVINAVSNQASSSSSSSPYRSVFAGPTAIKVSGLSPGVAYVFRSQQRNACGWSPWSRASKPIVTFPSLPPSAPAVVSLRESHAVLCWNTTDSSEENEMKNKQTVGSSSSTTTTRRRSSTSFTALEYEVNIGVLEDDFNGRKALGTKKQENEEEEEDRWGTMDLDALVAQALSLAGNRNRNSNPASSARATQTKAVGSGAAAARDVGSKGGEGGGGRGANKHHQEKEEKEEEDPTQATIRETQKKNVCWFVPKLREVHRSAVATGSVEKGEKAEISYSSSSGSSILGNAHADLLSELGVSPTVAEELGGGGGGEKDKIEYDTYFSSSAVDTAGAATDTDTADTTVMVLNLVPSTVYVARVRVRSVVGWSPWSAVSNPFRLLS